MGDEREELLRITKGLRSLVQRSEGAWPKGEKTQAPAQSRAAVKAPVQAPANEGKDNRRFKTVPQLQPYGDLASLHAAIKDCVKCPLGKTRTKFVFGAGDPHAKLMFVGEGPGRDEDLQGLPFVGRAGQLLTKIIEAIGMKREDVYIANIVKCRPPNNRPPEPEEVRECWPHLSAQINLIQPKVLCALGSYAARNLLGVETPISALRGKFHFIDGIPVMPTYHPAYLLRNPNDKGKVWEDMKKVRDLLKTL